MSTRTIDELQTQAVMWWPDELVKTVAEQVDLARLLATQADFLSLLILSKGKPFKIFELIKVAEFPANLFLKHLVILTDFGGEPIKRLGKSFTNIFPNNQGNYFFDFGWEGSQHRYLFQELPVRGLSNTKLAIDGAGQKTTTKLNALTQDMIAILLFAGLSPVARSAGLSVCRIGELLGKEEILTQHVKQKYLMVSRITAGTIVNKLGQTAQKQVIAFLKTRLGEAFSIMNNGKIILVGYDKLKGMPFDIVVEKGDRKLGIEISFQVTTNSTIERKAGQAANRQKLMHDNGHPIAYIIDGAGNFERRNALTTLIDNSDYVSAFSNEEFERLANWIEKTL